MNLHPKYFKVLTPFFLLILLLLSACQSSGKGTPVTSMKEARIMLTTLGGEISDDQTPLILFVTDWCPACRQAESDLGRRSIDFLKVDIEKDEKAAEIFEKIAKRTQTRAIPQLLIGENAYVGYSWQVVAQALGKKA